jgi:hypothetical protein
MKVLYIILLGVICSTRVKQFDNGMLEKVSTYMTISVEVTMMKCIKLWTTR